MSSLDNNEVNTSASLLPSTFTHMPFRELVPIGVFWDIENCGVPFHKSALGLVGKIRDTFFKGCKEAEFMCVCDTSNQNKETIQELNDAQVTVVHISAISKNTADDKIRQALRRFAANHHSPAIVILISGDVNFASDLSDLRYRHQFHVILIHRQLVSDALISCANDCYCFEEFIAELPIRKLPEDSESIRELVVKNLPVGPGVVNSLQRLCKSVRAKIIRIDGATALLRFPSNEATLRAQKWLNGEKVLGQKISVCFLEDMNKHPHILGKQKKQANSVASQKPLHVVCSTGKISMESHVPACETSCTDQSNASCTTNLFLKTVKREVQIDVNDKDKSQSHLKNSLQNSSDETQNFSEKLENHFQSADILSGDIVIEDVSMCDCNDEDDTKENHTVENTRNCGNCTDQVVDIIIPEKDTSGKKLKDSGNGKYSKRRRRQNSKSVSEKTCAPKISEKNKVKRPSVIRNKCSSSLSVDSSWKQVKSSDSCALGVRSQQLKGKNGISGNQVRSCSATPSDHTFMNMQLNGSESFPGNARVTSGSVQSACGKGERTIVLLSRQSGLGMNEEMQQHEKIPSSFSRNQQYGHDSNLSRGFDSKSVVDDDLGNGTNVFTTSSPWKGTPPDQSSLEILSHSTGFRRTPGARRPRSYSKDETEGSSSSWCQAPIYCPAVELNANDFSFSDCQRSQLSKFPDHGFPVSDYHSRKEHTSNSSSTEVDLVVSNLDYNISSPEWKKILMAEFQQHVHVVALNVQMLSDNTSIGLVRLSSLEDARNVVSLFHRKKIGYKRMHVALVHNDSSSIVNVKAEVADLLREVAGHRLPLFKFIELFEKRFHRGISVSELYHMKDTIEISELDGAGRVVTLVAATSNSMMLHSGQDDAHQTQQSSVCRIHCRKDGLNFLDAIDMSNIPHVILQLRSFSAQVHKLLQAHDGCLPLISFPSCFAIEFGELEPASDGGVPLEHLITCVPGVQLSISECGIKQVRWAENKYVSPFKDNIRSACNSPMLSQQLSQFSHEVIDLLKNSPQCRMPFSKFIPAYHHHFGRQCRVADYGYTKLLELFEAIPHVVQVIGSGSRRSITLTHRAQVKRFTVDLLRILKSQASKQISALDLPIVYNKVISRVFDMNEYGICFLEDMVGELPETTITTFGTGSDMVIALPKRDQTAEEMERTKQFALEAVDLLRHSPQCRMAFSKFIPAYHHHFGKQCRVADYGFTKLIELFEAIPTVIKIIDEQDEKFLSLTEEELIHVLEDQVAALLRTFPQNRITVTHFQSAFYKMFGHALQLSDFNVMNVVELVKKIPAVAKVIAFDGCTFIGLVDRTHIQMLAFNVLLILMDQTDGSISLELLVECYRQNFNSRLDTKSLSDLSGFIEVVVIEDKKVVKLCPLQMFARDVRTLLLESGKHLQLSQFEKNYADHFGVALCPASYGFPSVLALIQAVPHIVIVKGKNSRHTLSLTPHFQERLPQSFGEGVKDSKYGTSSSDFSCIDQRAEDQEIVSALKGRVTATDLLCDPVPSGIPSPELLPQPKRPPSSLMYFDSISYNQEKDFLMLTEEEKHGLRTPLCRTPVSDLLAFAAQLLPTPIYHHGGLEPYTGREPLSMKVSSALALLERAVFSRVNETRLSDDQIVKDDHSASNDDQAKIFHMDEKIVDSNSNIKIKNQFLDNDPCMSQLEGETSLQDQMKPNIHGLHGTVENKPQQLMVTRTLNSCVADLKLSSPEVENATNIMLNSTTLRKADSTKRSRIAARFDLSPISADHLCCS